VQPNPAGDYAVAIRLERSFELPFAGLDARGVTIANATHSRDRQLVRAKARSVFYRARVSRFPGTPKLKVPKNSSPPTASHKLLTLSSST